MSQNCKSLLKKKEEEILYIHMYLQVFWLV